MKIFKLVFCILFVGSTLTISSLAKDSPEITINGKPVPRVIAQVNGTDIPSDFLLNQLKARSILGQRQGKGFTPEENEAFALKEIDKAIDQELLFQKGKELDIKVAPATIKKEIENIRNKFPSKELFLSALAFQNLTIDKLTRRIEKQLTEEEFLRKEIAPKINVADEKVRTYYKKHKNSFKASEKYKVSHLFVSTLNPSKNQPEDEASRDKAKRIRNAINKQSKSKIMEAFLEAKQGKDFSKLCARYSEDETTKDKGGHMGELSLRETLPSLAEAIERLRVGEISGIVESPYGYHILKLTGKIPEKQIPLKEVKSDILNVILKMEMEKKKKEYLNNLKKSAIIKVFL